MADEEEEEGPFCSVVYTDLPEGETEETNWIKRAGRATVTYVNGCTFTGWLREVFLEIMLRRNLRRGSAEAGAGSIRLGERAERRRRSDRDRPI